MNPITLHGKTESELAAYQRLQIGNTCSFYVIAAGLRLLLNYHIDPVALSDEIDRLWWRGRFMRVWPDWAVTPRMQVRIVRYLAKKHNLPIIATFHKGDPETLADIIPNPNCVAIITLVWLWREAPPIYLGNTLRNFNLTHNPGGHTMLLAAYDPAHKALGEFPTPWGFINPWIENAKHLFWMADEDFQKAWGLPLPLVGPNPLVVMRRLPPG